VITATSDWMERHIFAANENRCQQNREPRNSLSFGPEPQDGYFKLYMICDPRDILISLHARVLEISPEEMCF
jgi:hypothetical protein